MHDDLHIDELRALLSYMQNSAAPDQEYLHRLEAEIKRREAAEEAP